MQLCATAEGARGRRASERELEARRKEGVDQKKGDEEIDYDEERPGEKEEEMTEVEEEDEGMRRKEGDGECSVLAGSNGWAGKGVYTLCPQG